tara:strand:- start:16282 stop:20115 length:3834 start_codon:yes stop_codon:yes gene_type:complete
MKNKEPNQNIEEDQDNQKPKEKIIARVIEDEMKESYLRYAMSVIVSRALPDVRDGLKPVHRRILFAMHEMGMLPNKPFKKSARIVGECFVKNTLINTPKGLIPIENLKVGNKVYTQKGIKSISNLYEMPKKALIEVKLENGLSNTITKSQKFKIFTSDLKIKWKKASELKKGDHIVLKSVYPNIKKEVKLSSGKRLNENIAYTLGFFLSDGWIEKKTGRIGFYSTSKNIIEKIKNVLKKEFNYKTNILTKKPLGFKEGYYTRIDKSKIINFWINNFKIKDVNASTKRIPQQILRSPKRIIYSFLSGLFDGDGSIHKSRNVIHYGSVSYELIDKLQILLLSLGIFSKRYVSTSKTHFIKNRQIKTNYPFYNLEIRGKNCLDLCKNLKLNEINKQKKLLTIKFSLKKKNFSENIPYASKHIFRELSKHHLGGGWYKDTKGNKFRLGIQYNKSCKIRYSKNLTKRPLGKEQIINWNILKKLKLIGSPLGGIFENIIKENLIFIKVKEVLESLSEKTYDIQVKDDHEFIANGMISHNCLGKYHPHGDTAVYDSMVRMAQPWSLRYPLIKGQGNFGSIDGDRAAAMRYTEARLSKISTELLTDIEKQTVDFKPNFDTSLKEPVVLPSKIPNLLLNGSSGIAVGMATNIPPHNLIEVCDAIDYIINNPEADINTIIGLVKGPDFPTGGIIIGRSGIKDAYLTGRGKITIRGKTSIEEKKDKKKIIIHEIPYQLNKSSLIEEIADNVKNKKIIGISNIRDESDKQGMRIVIILKKDINQDIVLNQLYKKTRLQTTFGINMLALVNNEPKTLNIKQIIEEFIKHRKEVVIRRTTFDLKKAELRAHILEGLIIALNDIDNIVQKIKKSKDVKEAVKTLISDYKLTETQAKAILDMKLQKLASLEQEKIKTENKELQKLIKELKEILASDKRIFNIIKEELTKIKEKYGDERKTELSDEEKKIIDIEDMIKEEDMIITVTHQGYIKRLTIDTYKKQKRGGKGVIATTTKDEDFVSDLFIASTHSYILFFTDKGQVHWLKVYEIPIASRQAKGKAIINLLNIKDEKITAMVPIREFKQGNLIMATKNGTVKKADITMFQKPRKGGIRAITLDQDDHLINVVKTDGNKQILLATKNGMAIRFKEEDLRSIGRTGKGVRGIYLKNDDKVIDMIVVDNNKDIFTVTEKGYGKRTKIEEYRIINRGGVGVINIKTDERNGKVIGACSVQENNEIMLISKNGIMIRTPVKGISCIGRNTKGVRIMRLSDNDKLVAITKIVQENNGNGNKEETK